MYGDVGMHHIMKNCGNKGVPLTILSSKQAQSCVTRPYIQRVAHDCASILDRIVKGTLLFPRLFTWCIPTSPYIQLNNFLNIFGEAELRLFVLRNRHMCNHKFVVRKCVVNLFSSCFGNVWKREAS